MSTTSAGRASRSFITETSDCPPASAFASGSASAASASSRSPRDVANRGGDHRSASPAARTDSTIVW